MTNLICDAILVIDASFIALIIVCAKCKVARALKTASDAIANGPAQC